MAHHTNKTYKAKSGSKKKTPVKKKTYKGKKK